MTDNFEIWIFILYNRENINKTLTIPLSENKLDSGKFVCKISQCKSFKNRTVI